MHNALYVRAERAFDVGWFLRRDESGSEFFLTSLMRSDLVNHPHELIFIQDPRAELPGLVELRARVGAGDHVGGLPGHTGRHFAAQRLDTLLCFGTCHGGEGAGEDEGLPAEFPCAPGSDFREVDNRFEELVDDLAILLLREEMGDAER